jgi:DNA repair photolyase
VSLISKFDPWNSLLCTCPPKLTFNPYTGCDHACTYCYASSYIPEFQNCRPKKNVLKRLRSEAAKLKGELLSISNSSDPYPSLEDQTGLMRSCLQILSHYDCKVQIITKSDLVVRDIDLLTKIRSMVSVTVTTDDDNVGRLIEPYAPPPSARLESIRMLIEKGVPTSVRIDPIIPHMNDNPEKLVKKLASIGVSHITSSTYKVRRDNWQRLRMKMPKLAEKLEALYFSNGQKIGGYLYLPSDLRFKLMKKVAHLAQKCNLNFGTCREGFHSLNTASCDGSWLIDQSAPKPAH